MIAHNSYDGWKTTDPAQYDPYDERPSPLCVWCQDVAVEREGDECDDCLQATWCDACERVKVSMMGDVCPACAERLEAQSDPWDRRGK